jgi:hypothetical protein
MQYSVVSEWPMAATEAGGLRQVEDSPERSRKTRSKAGDRGRMRRPRKQHTAWDNHAMIQALETLARMLTPQVMLPVQLKSEPEDLPEFGLLRAVLLSAVVDYVDSFKPSPTSEVAQRRREARRVAESWFAGDPGAPIEFDLCCAMYGLSADQMRAKIKQLTKRLSAPWN